MLHFDLAEAAKDKVRALACGAAKNDYHMLPLYEKAKGVEFLEFSQSNQEAWMGTGHFERYYDCVITQIADDEEMRNTGDAVPHHGERWLHDLYLTLREVFWDSWDDAVGLYAGWKKAQE